MLFFLKKTFGTHFVFAYMNYFLYLCSLNKICVKSIYILS